MNKRQKKKFNSGLIKIKNLKQGNYLIFIDKRLWNKGNPQKGHIQNPQGDYLAFEMAKKRKKEYLVHVSNCRNCNVKLLKGNSNRRVKIVKDLKK
jgi:hypothetical protein